MSTVSVIILTANRRALLERALHALAQGVRRPDEVVVVNNRSEDDTVEFLSKQTFEFALRVIDGPEGSFSECRNAGVEAATSEWVAFLDDDCEADLWWLERLVVAVEKNDWAAAGGAVLPATQLPSPSWYSPELSWTVGCSTPLIFTPLAGRLEIPTTSNLIYRRDLHPEFSFRVLTAQKSALTWNYEFSREDSQLWRDLRRAGKNVGVEARAIVWHHVRADRIDRERMRERARQDGRGFWRRDGSRADTDDAVRDVVYTVQGLFDDVYTHARPPAQAWEARAAWARRQLAFLEYAVDDHNRGIPPEQRLGRYVIEGARAAASIAKAALRPAVTMAYGAYRHLAPLPTVDDPPSRMTVVLHDLLGDAVLALPMLRQLAAGFPGCVITVLTGPSAAPLLRAASATSNLHIVEVPAAARGRGARNAAALSKFLRDRDADAILIAYCHNLHPAPLFIQGEAPVVAWPLDNGLDQRLYADLLAARIPKNFQKAEVAALLDLLNPFGIETRLERPSFQPSAEARESISGILAKAGLADRTYAVLHVEPATRAKNWPMERFFEVADFIHDAGVEVVLEGSRASRIASEEARAERPWCHSVQGLLDTDELGALIERSRFFVGCDSGPAHVAQAVGAPALLLFGATEPHRWGPLPQLPSETSLPWQVLRAAPGDWLVEETRGLTVNEGLSLLSAGHVCEVLAGFMKSVENIAPGVERH